MCHRCDVRVARLYQGTYLGMLERFTTEEWRSTGRLFGLVLLANLPSRPGSSDTDRQPQINRVCIFNLIDLYAPAALYLDRLCMTVFDSCFSISCARLMCRWRNPMTIKPHKWHCDHRFFTRFSTPERNLWVFYSKVSTMFWPRGKADCSASAFISMGGPRFSRPHWETSSLLWDY